MDFYKSMKRAHTRTLNGIGMEQFKAQIVDKFPLALDDSSVIEIAEEMGWSQQWMHPRTLAILEHFVRSASCDLDYC